MCGYSREKEECTERDEDILKMKGRVNLEIKGDREREKKTTQKRWESEIK